MGSNGGDGEDKSEAIPQNGVGGQEEQPAKDSGVPVNGARDGIALSQQNDPEHSIEKL